MNFASMKAQVWRCASSLNQLALIWGGTGSLEMYSNSAGEQDGCSCGGRKTTSHSPSHMNPTPPNRKKAERQPQCTAIHGTMRGVAIAPRLLPALKIPVASARSFLGNHSATAFRLAGNTADSPNPKAKRATRKPVNELARPCAIEARLQNAMAKA